MTSKHCTNSLARCVGAVCALGFVLPAACGSQTLPWRSDWTISAAPSIVSDLSGVPPPAPVVLAPDGDLLLRASSLNFNDQIVRFGADGSVRWRVNLGGLDMLAPYGAGPLPVVAATDGSVYAATRAGAALAKIDASGQVVWSTAVPTRYLAVAGDTAFALDCDTVVAVNAQDGQRRWSFKSPTLYGCIDPDGVVTDDSGNVYAGFSGKLFKFDAEGHVLWQQTGIGTLVGIGSGKLYGAYRDIQYTPHVSAADAANGVLSWDIEGADPLTVAGSPAELLVSTLDSVQRIAADTGEARWVQAVRDVLTAAPCAGNTVLADFARLDLDTGAVLWTATPPAADAYGHVLTYFAAGCLADGSAYFAAKPRDYPAPPRLIRANGATGAVLGTIPLQPGAQATVGASIRIDAQAIADVAPGYSEAGAGLRVRLVNAADGTQLWDASDDSHPMGLASVVSPAVAGDSDAVYATLTGTADSGGVLVDAFDRASGTRRWSVFITENDYRLQGETLSAPPALDGDGNPVIAYTASLVQVDPLLTGPLTQVSVVKLSKSDGHVLWRHDEITPIGAPLAAPAWLYPAAPSLAVVGGDVFVAGEFPGPRGQYTLLKLVGADGSFAWGTTQFPGDDPYWPWLLPAIFPAPDGNVLLVGTSAWAELDAQSGAMLWSNAAALEYSCGTRAVCIAETLALAPDGALWYATHGNAGAELVRATPGPNGAVSTLALNEDPCAVRDLHFDAVGDAWARLSCHYPYDASIDFLLHVDAAAGAIRSRQALSARTRDPLQPAVEIAPLGAPSGDRMVASGNSYAPSVPATLSSALVDTTIRASGDLTVHIAADAYVSAGQDAAFDIVVDYAGDAPLTDVRVFADFPWIGKATGLSCATQAASNCSLDQRSDTLVATFDVQPGERVDIRGAIRATPHSDSAVIGAIVVGPVGLDERDAVNNAAQVTVDQTVFADGFE